jgi:cell volume regulation protein A
MEAINLITAIILLVSAFLILGVLSSLVATRFGAPLLLIFLVIGMLAGEDGPGGIVFNDFRIAYLVGSTALAVILFDGGLRTKLTAFRGVLVPSALLATVGVALTAGLTAIPAIWLLGLDPWEGMLLGSIVAATDAAAVFVLLRAGGLELRRRSGATIEIESATNDPTAVFLTVAIASLLQAAEPGPWETLALALLREAGIGGALGLAGGLLICLTVNRLDLAEGLHSLLVVALAVALYALTTLIHGSGYLAVFVAGLVVGNRPVRAYASIVSQHNTATWLCQIVMFLILGLLATPSRLVALATPAIALALFLILIARPLAVWLCLAPFGYDRREIAFVGWVGLRGAVSIFLATIPLLSGLPQALTYFDVAFFVVLVSLLVQGWTVGAAARRLNQALPRKTRPVHRVELDLPGQLAQELVGYHVIAGSPLLLDRRLPDWARPVFVIRDETVTAPDAAGPLRPNDYVYLLAPPERAYRLDRLFAADVAGGETAPGEFAIDGTTSLVTLAELYDVPVDPADQERTVAELFADRFEGQPQVGDRLPFGDATLVARVLDEERVERAGLLLEELTGSLVAASLLRHRAGRALWRLMRRVRPSLRLQRPG